MKKKLLKISQGVLVVALICWLCGCTETKQPPIEHYTHYFCDGGVEEVFVTRSTRVLKIPGWELNNWHNTIVPGAKLYYKKTIVKKDKTIRLLEAGNLVVNKLSKDTLQVLYWDAENIYKFRDKNYKTYYLCDFEVIKIKDI